MTKSAKIRRLLSKNTKPVEIAKKLKVNPNLVYQVAWHAKKAKKKKPLEPTSESPQSKLIQAVMQTQQALDVIDKKPLYDLVHRPPHYTDGGIETIDFIEAKDLNYRLGNVIKYVSRAGKKVDSDPIQDLEKARFYLEREIEARRDA